MAADRPPPASFEVWLSPGNDIPFDDVREILLYGWLRARADARGRVEGVTARRLAELMPGSKNAWAATIARLIAGGLAARTDRSCLVLCKKGKPGEFQLCPEIRTVNDSLNSCESSVCPENRTSDQSSSGVCPEIRTNVSQANNGAGREESLSFVVDSRKSLKTKVCPEIRTKAHKSFENNDSSLITERDTTGPTDDLEPSKIKASSVCPKTGQSAHPYLCDDDAMNESDRPTDPTSKGFPRARRQRPARKPVAADPDFRKLNPAVQRLVGGLDGEMRPWREEQKSRPVRRPPDPRFVFKPEKEEGRR